MNRCRSCGRETRGNLCSICQRDFDRGDPDGPLRELDEESLEERTFFKGGSSEVDEWERTGP